MSPAKRKEFLIKSKEQTSIPKSKNTKKEAFYEV